MCLRCALPRTEGGSDKAKPMEGFRIASLFFSFPDQTHTHSHTRTHTSRTLSQHSSHSFAYTHTLSLSHSHTLSHSSPRNTFHLHPTHTIQLQLLHHSFPWRVLLRYYARLESSLPHSTAIGRLSLPPQQRPSRHPPPNYQLSYQSIHRY